jgi:hypothetical protein
VLDERLGVPEPLDDEALGLIFLEVSYCSVPGSAVRTISMASADKRLNSSTLPS